MVYFNEEEEQEELAKLNDEVVDITNYNVWIDIPFQEVFANTEIGDTAVGYLDGFTIDDVVECLYNFEGSECYDDLLYEYDYGRDTLNDVVYDIQNLARDLETGSNNRY